MKIWTVLAEAKETLVVFADNEQDAADIAFRFAEEALEKVEPTLQKPVEIPPGSQITGVGEHCLVYHELNGDLPLWEARQISAEEARKRAAEAEFRRRQLDMFKGEAISNA